jgi:hypothetical protein
VRKTFLSTLALALLLFGGARLSAQELKPVAVLSVASYDTLKADLKFAGELADTPGLDAMADGMLQMVSRGTLTKKLDSTKPFGAVVFLDGQMPKGFGFLPISDLKGVLAVVSPAPPTENNGVLEIQAPNGQTIYAVQKGSWACISNEQEVLKNAPADPEKLLDGLDKKYAVAFRLSVQNIPADLRNNFAQLLRSLVEVGLVQNPGEDETTFEFRKKMVQGQLKQIDALVKEIDQLTFGWAIDPAAKSTFLDMSLTAVAGTDTARKLSGVANVKSDFLGFLLPDAAFNFNVCEKFEPADVAQFVAMIQTARQKANEAIDNDATIPNAEGKTEAKKVVAQLLDVAENTLKSGKFDGGAALSLAPNSLAFAAGGFIKDGATLDAALRELVKLAGNDPGFPSVKFDAETYKGIKVHSAAIPMMDDNAKKLFGDTMDAYLGIGDDSVYIAFGKGSLAMVKSIIDKPSAGSGAGNYFAQANVALTPILKFIDSTNPDPHLKMVAQVLEGTPGKDHVRLLEGVIANGVNLQIQFEEGVLKAIGAAIKEKHGMGAPRGG